MLDDAFLRSEVEPYIDNLYRSSPLLKRHRDTAVIHLLRVFEDALRFGPGHLTPNSREHLQSFLQLRFAQEALPWAMRWAWNDCPRDGAGSLELDWDAYREAADLLDLSFRYYHLYRCFVLYSRNIFAAEVDASEKRVRFSFISQLDERRDACGALYLMERDNPHVPKDLVRSLGQMMPVVYTVLPHYIRKTGESSIRYTVAPEIRELFERWATLNTKHMRFELPETWELGGFNLHQFRSFWNLLLSTAVAHSIAHGIADDAVGTRHGALASVIIHLKESEFLELIGTFPAQLDKFRKILEVLVYNPTRNYWDPIWQPIIRLSDQTILISSQLIISSSPERNLIILLGRNADWRRYYNQVSAEKEKQQLNELESLFSGDRYAIRKCVRIFREDGTTLSDIDVLVFDRAESFALLIHAKWLIRPDFVAEILAKDEELSKAIETARACSKRVGELGTKWLCRILGVPEQHIAIGSTVVSRDFIPSGWIYDPEVPVIDMEFLQRTRRSATYVGLKSLYINCKELYVWLQQRHPVTLGKNEVQFGEYLFELPTYDVAH
jgi:hypothetical protein